MSTYEVLYTTEHYESNNLVWQGILKSKSDHIFYTCWHDVNKTRLVVQCYRFSESILPRVYDLARQASWSGVRDFFYKNDLYHNYFHNKTPEDLVRFWALKAFH